MCGIIASIGEYRYKEIPEALIERGRDDSGIYQDEYVQLIQTRLHITGGKVKLPYEWNDYVLLFNGEIYNWKELGGENEYQSILMAYHRDENMDEVLDGQYAIIIYNKRDNECEYFLDKHRIHTLYYDNDIYSSNLRSLPSIEFNKIQSRGYGNITKQRVL
jgi:asparagine synthase (glutamine-hydrolysing)